MNRPLQSKCESVFEELSAALKAIQVAFDQYAEAALDNRRLFLSKSHSIG
jgi:uncharacterized membrane protein YccC